MEGIELLWIVMVVFKLFRLRLCCLWLWLKYGRVRDGCTHFVVVIIVVLLGDCVLIMIILF